MKHDTEIFGVSAEKQLPAEGIAAFGHGRRDVFRRFLDITVNASHNEIMDFVPILAVIVSLAVVMLVIFLITGRNSKSVKKDVHKSSQAAIRDAERKLAQDPHNTGALATLANIQFRDHQWEKAFQLYGILLEISAIHPEVNKAEAGLRRGISAIKLNKPADAVNGLVVAAKTEPGSFEVNYYLGQALLMTNENEKAIPLLKKALSSAPDNPEIFKPLGMALYKTKSYREAAPYLNRALAANPDDKEALFSMADCLAETGNSDKALKIFTHLRPNPEFGARASLAAGMIHTSTNQLEDAIEDFDIGLKHADITPQLAVDIRYRRAQCYLRQNNINRAIEDLNSIHNTVPNYKDVETLLSRYRELNQNKNLQIYLIATNSEFVGLCRKLVTVFFKRAQVKILDISSLKEYTEILTEVDTPKWQDIVVFRFYRTTGTIGDLFVRDFHAHIRDSKAGRGFCITAGTFSEEAKKFIEGRPIDLIDKTLLNKFLAQIGTS